MTRYIPLEPLVAEIKKQRNAYIGEPSKYKVLSRILSFIDTLEVKEADLDIQTFAKEMYTVFTLPSSETNNTEKEPLDWKYAIAKHFFELGLNAQVQAIWHDVSKEIPTKYGEDILVACRNKNKEDGIWLYDLIDCWEGEWNPRVNWEDPVKWAYVKDFAPPER